MKNKFAPVLVLALSVVGVSSVASASSLLALTGSVQVTGNALNFGAYNGGSYAPYPGNGTFLASNASTGIFAPEDNLIGDIFSLSMSSISSPFITFADGTDFYVTSVLPGNTVTAGVCTTSGTYNGVFCYAETGSPITLTDGTTGAQATLGFVGYVTTSHGPSPQAYTGQFQATFTGTTVAQLEQAFASAGFIDTTYSGTFLATAAPEPSSALLGGVGGIMILAGLYRRRRNS